MEERKTKEEYEVLKELNERLADFSKTKNDEKQVDDGDER